MDGPTTNGLGPLISPAHAVQKRSGRSSTLPSTASSILVRRRTHSRTTPAKHPRSGLDPRGRTVCGAYGHNSAALASCSLPRRFLAQLFRVAAARILVRRWTTADHPLPLWLDAVGPVIGYRAGETSEAERRIRAKAKASPRLSAEKRRRARFSQPLLAHCKSGRREPKPPRPPPPCSPSAHFHRSVQSGPLPTS
jgi:hypothetical protein